jgi:hypothetical protein
LFAKGGFGGALFVNNNSEIHSCKNCKFIGNLANTGGAVFLQ